MKEYSVDIRRVGPHSQTVELVNWKVKWGSLKMLCCYYIMSLPQYTYVALNVVILLALRAPWPICQVTSGHPIMSVFSGALMPVVGPLTWTVHIPNNVRLSLQLL